MPSEGSTELILKRKNDELALMPPPPVKRIKRPTEVLEEDDYTEVLSDIIARDYYPGLREVKAQEDYLEALESKNIAWMQDAEKELRAARDGIILPKKGSANRRPTALPRPYTQAEDTPRNPSGAETPVTTAEEQDSSNETIRTLDASELSLSSYQAKYTSEDNASFNDIVDKQNETRRKKYAHLWTSDQRIPSQRLIAQRASTQQRIQDHADYERANGKQLIPLTTGAVSSRTAKPDSWKSTTPANTLMFMPTDSVDEQGLQTTAELKESLSKAGPKEIVHENTRFLPSGPRWEAAADDDDATSIHTSFIARRNAAGTDISTVTGAETPRVNGYAFVDDDEEEPPPQASSAPSYRDLLAGQAGNGSRNPFNLKSSSAREDLHHRLVEQDAEKKRARQKEVTKAGGSKELGNMTPAARKMMERLGGGTPTSDRRSRTDSRQEDWMPMATPRRNRTVVK